MWFTKSYVSYALRNEQTIMILFFVYVLVVIGFTSLTLFQVFACAKNKNHTRHIRIHEKRRTGELERERRIKEWWSSVEGWSLSEIEREASRQVEFVWSSNANLFLCLAPHSANHKFNCKLYLAPQLTIKHLVDCSRGPLILSLLIHFSLSSIFFYCFTINIIAQQLKKVRIYWNYQLYLILTASDCLSFCHFQFNLTSFQQFSFSFFISVISSI